MTLTNEIYKMQSTSIRFLGLQTLWSLPYYWCFWAPLKKSEKIVFPFVLNIPYYVSVIT